MNKSERIKELNNENNRINRKLKDIASHCKTSTIKWFENYANTKIKQNKHEIEQLLLEMENERK